MSYVYPNYKSKAALKRALVAGEKVICKDNTPFGYHLVAEGTAYVEGPHYPQPHKWYGKVICKDGRVISVT